MVPTKRLFTYGGVETLLVRIPFDQHVFRGGASLIVKRFFYVTSIICTSSFTANAGITRVDCSNCRPALIAAFRYARYAAMPPRCCIFYHQLGTRVVIFELRVAAEELLLHVDCRK